MKQVKVKLSDINRPHQSVIDGSKLSQLMASIDEIGLQEPIDLLEIDGKLYGFNGCHRYTAHKCLGMEYIEANVRSVDRATFKLHLM